MVIIHKRAKRKATGGRYKSKLAKRQLDAGNVPTLTKIGATKRKTIRIVGANKKTKLLHCDIVNLADSKSKKITKAKILKVVENPANRNYARRNILTKGAIIETDKGKARITSKPGQEGNVNAVLVQ